MRVGVFGIFGKKKASKPPPVDAPAQAPGWAAIEKAFAALYPGSPPKWWEHNGVHAMHDLNNPPENPLEAVALYDAGPFWHFVSFGLSDLFGARPNEEWSGFGYEFTFRLAKDENPLPSLGPVDILVSLAKAAYKGANFAPGHTIKTGPLDGRAETPLTALVITTDPALELIETPNGKVALLLLVGVEGTVRERPLSVGVDSVLAELRASNPELMTRI
jgi:Suppressor of fused protein (SUFU)